MKLDVSVEKVFPVDLGRVWHALTDSAMISRWLMRTEGFEAKIGTRFTLRGERQPGFRGYVECEVLELAPPHRMVWSWSSTDDGTPTRLVIELEAQGDATRLTLRHTGDVDERTRRGTTAGWPVKLGVLAQTLGPPNDLGPGQRSTQDQPPGPRSGTRQLDL